VADRNHSYELLPPTRAYVERRTAQGLSKPEIIRCLKRYVAREIYPRLRAAAD
jgi:transposase